MVLEMRRALEQLKKGEEQGYRKLYDATYEDVYCRSLLVLQQDEQALDFMEKFYTALFSDVDEVALPVNPEKWFWQRYYREMRKEYHQLLEGQKKGNRNQESTLAAVPAALPLLHRILLVMSYMDDFPAEEIGETFGLPADKVETELGKVGNLLPNLTKNQPEKVASYLKDWRLLLMGACRQLSESGQGEWIDRIYKNASKAAGILDAPVKESDDFEYFVADVDVEPEEPKKKKAAPVVEEPDDDEDEDEDESEDDEDDDESYDDDEDDDDDENDEDDEEDDDRYDWDLEDDNRKMVILGVVLAFIIVVVIGIGAYTFLNRDKGSSAEPSQTTSEEEEGGNAELVIKGDSSSSDDSSDAETSEDEETEGTDEETDAEQPAEEESAEPETVTMKVSASSVNVRSEASTDSSIVTKVTSGETVEVVGEIGRAHV